MKRWLKRAYRHHAQSRELKRFQDLSLSRAVKQGASTKHLGLSGQQHPVEEPLDFAGTLGDLGRPARRCVCRHRNSSSAMLSAARTARLTESLVGVESEAARIFSSTYAASRVDVRGIERRADGISLAVDLDGNDLALT